MFDNNLALGSASNIRRSGIGPRTQKTNVAKSSCSVKVRSVRTWILVLALCAGARLLIRAFVDAILLLEGIKPSESHQKAAYETGRGKDYLISIA